MLIEAVGSSGLAGQPGNEAGYVVKMTDEVLNPPYKISPGTPIRIESAYQGSKRRLGVMVNSSHHSFHPMAFAMVWLGR